MEEELKRAALAYHRQPRPGKISVTPTKGLTNQRDLSLAYSPGVAAACLEIHASPATARDYTVRGNLVAVITNGTAVLGLGNIGPLAAKPVMEGKGVLFKKFAGIDVFDIEVAETDPDRFIEVVAALEPTFGGINLEDVKAPECFYIERKLRERMKVPVFHDDQHGTAIIVAAAVINYLKLSGKRIQEVRLVTSGAGASALACLELLVSLGLRRENVIVTDSKGVIYRGRREGMDPYKETFAQETGARTLADALPGADIFLGLSAPGVMKPEMVKTMGTQPLVMALANPEPEIRPELAKKARSDCIVATGRSDYPNQINNVLCFPFMFRGALDVGATTITREMEHAAARALADLTQLEESEIVAHAYGGQELVFGPEYLIPRPFDPRLILKVAPAVARAAMDAGVATRPIEDFDAYRQELQQYVYQSGTVMKPVFAAAKAAPEVRVVYAEGEDERVLRGVQTVIDENLARPVLIGRAEVVERNVKRLGLRMREGADYELVNQDSDLRYRNYWTEYHRIMERRGVSTELARTEMRSQRTLIGSMMMHMGDADAMLCGTSANYRMHLGYVASVVGLRPGARIFAAMNMLILPNRTVFICDTYVNRDPSAEQLVEMTLMAAEQVRRFGMVPRVALLSHSSFGSSPDASAEKMSRAREMLERIAPDLECDGEMHGDAALSEEIRLQMFPNSRLKGEANLLIMPNIEAANISFNLLKTAAGGGITVGPMLLGAAAPVHILSASASVRRIINMTALLVVDAAARKARSAGTGG